ncbi:TRAP transporter substrate-binding protein DctP [Piscinibacter sakaiensis]|uniref:TRAP transporter substrate-binding protein DctP n=1 Tax=Piscinibacter sakaiensis TaxID=1547922 RepID=UPI003AAB03A1
MAHSKIFRTLALAAACSTAAFAQAQEVTLRAINAFQEGTTFAKPFEAFIDKVNANGKGLLKINYIGGPKAMPPFEVGNAVKNGVVDIANVTGAFYTNLMPEADAFKLAERTIQEQRKNGAWEFINKLHNDKLNAWYLARTGDGVPFHLYLNKPLDKPDLKGLKLRVTPVYRAFFNDLGANLVQTAPGEVYTALERNVIDGYGWPTQGILDLGWQEKTKFRVDPGFYTVDVNFLVNLDTWKKLNDAQRALLTKTAAEIEASNADNVQINQAEVKKQSEAGIKAITFEGKDRETWLNTARESGWAQIKKVAPANADRLRELLAK